MNLFATIRMLFGALTRPRLRISIRDLPPGRILDIGGGGEGVMARAGGARVVAVDRLASEIVEAKAHVHALDASWVLADASRLPFTAGCFDSATAFFSFMYMLDDVLPRVLSETARVLKQGGELWIWDVPMVGPAPSKGAARSKTFALMLGIDIPSRPTINTAYGVKAKDRSAALMGRLLREAGFEPAIVVDRDRWFFIRATKL